MIESKPIFTPVSTLCLLDRCEFALTKLVDNPKLLEQVTQLLERLSEPETVEAVQRIVNPCPFSEDFWG